MSLPTSPSKSQLALLFVGLSLILTAIAIGVAKIGIMLFAVTSESPVRVMPVPFWISTALLAVGSVTLQRAAWHVRIQRLEQFQRCLLLSLVIGTLFVGLQSAGLWCLVRKQDPHSAETGVNAFIVMVAGLHGIHFVIALLFVVWITVNAFANRYDHEYFWSVTFCAWFWHTLGIVWLAILTLFAAEAVTGQEGFSTPDPQMEIVARTRSLPVVCQLSPEYKPQTLSCDRFICRWTCSSPLKAKTRKHKCDETEPLHLAYGHHGDGGVLGRECSRIIR